MQKLKHPYLCIRLFSIIFICVLNITSCSKVKSEEQENTMEKKIYLPDKDEVDIIILQKGVFKKEIVSNGKLVALQKNDLKFEVSETLENLLVKNGDIVKQGQTLAVLRPFTYQQALTKAETNLQKAELEFQDKLLGRGYASFNEESIPKAEYAMLAIRSGYNDALHELKNAKFDLQSTKLIAPFSGKIANIEAKQYEQISSGETIMTLINDTVFDIEFYLIESEVGEIAVNDKINIAPFALSKTYEGQITTINPQVEKDGTVLVKAKVKNDGSLMEGMNVKVFIQKDVLEQFVVPKSAVILRQNQEVLFTLKSGRTYWTYVQTTNENSGEYSVIPHPDKSSATLNPGDTIIVSGNLNLAHDVEVQIKSTKAN